MNGEINVPLVGLSELNLAAVKNLREISVSPEYLKLAIDVRSLAVKFVDNKERFQQITIDALRAL